MSHSNSPPYYPSPFPSQVQRTQISSYSSLANALGTDPRHASRQGRGPFLTKSDVLMDTQATFSDRPSVSNSSHPYPTRHASDSGAYHVRALWSVSNGRFPSNAGTVLGENSDQKDLPRFPPSYDCLPQPFFVEPNKHHGYQAGADFPAIQFLRREDKDPYSIWDLLTMDTTPDLVAGNLPVLVQSPDRWMKIELIWPGYSRYPFEKRIPLKRGAPLTPTLLLMALARHMDEFIRWLQNEGAVVEPGQEY